MEDTIRRVLITGAAGFIGSALAEHLARDENKSLILIDKLEGHQLDEDVRDLTRRPNVQYRSLDMLEKKGFDALPKDIDTIFHMAAVVGVEQVLRTPDRVLEVNATTTLNLFNYARTLTNTNRVLFSSTSEVYAGTLKHFGIALPTPEHVPLCLDDITSPRTTYALSKIYGEAIAFAWRKMHGIPITVVRFHNVYGPRMGFRHIIPQTFVKIARSNGTIDVPSPTHTRAFCYIDDAVTATVRCAEAKSTEGQIIHIGASSEEITVRDLVHKVATTMGQDIVVRDLPDTPGSPARRCPDTSALQRLTGYRAQVSLDDGLRRTYAWYKDRLPG